MPRSDESPDEKSLREIAIEALQHDEPGDLENAQEALRLLREQREKE